MKDPNLKDKIKETVEDIWGSVFRHGYKDTPRNRILQIISNVWLHLHPARVREHGTKLRFTWCMGGITFFVFLVEVVTGILLMFYYTPDVNKAFADTMDLMYTVPFGRLMRNVHRWGAHAMVITVSIHMFRVFLTGSYKPPRRFNWVIGVFLLLLTFLLSFTGYLLPWDQLGYWAFYYKIFLANHHHSIKNHLPHKCHTYQLQYIHPIYQNNPEYNHYYYYYHKRHNYPI